MSNFTWPLATRVHEAFAHSRHPAKWNVPDDFDALTVIALDLTKRHPEDVIVAGVRSLGRSDDPAHRLRVHVEAVTA